MRQPLAILTCLLPGMLFLVWSASANAQEARDVLTNQSVVELVDLGVSEDVILGMIAERPNDFSLYPEDLEWLEARGVPSTVIRSMLATDDLGALRIVTVPSSANVTIGGRYVGVTPYVGTLREGEYVVGLERAGYVSEEWTAYVTVGQEVTLSSTMDRQDRRHPDTTEDTEADSGEDDDEGGGSKKPLLIAGAAAAGAGVALALTRDTEPDVVGRWHQTSVMPSSNVAWAFEDLELFADGTVTVQEYDPPFRRFSGIYRVSGSSITMEFPSFSNRQGTFTDTSMTLTAGPLTLFFERIDR